jgi:2-polyprenyl-3-methyl-5-hydroxy-6-metoxy-1,4-benzoquinol methylase
MRNNNKIQEPNDRVREISKRYDKVAEYFTEWVPSTQLKTIFNNTVLKILDNQLADHESIKVLDVGCGHGTWIKYILENVKSRSKLDVTGIDLSHKRIELAKSTLTNYPNVSLRVGDIRTYESDKSYDLIFFTEVFCFIEKSHYHDVFKVCFELLNKCGYLVIIDKDKYSVYNVKFLLRKLRKNFEGIYREAGTWEFIEHPSFRHLLGVARKNSFSLVDKPKIKEFHGLILSKSI